MFPGHMIKRTIDVVQDMTKDARNDKPQISPIGVLIFMITVTFCLTILAAISYTYGHLITTLAMVESSSSTAYVPIHNVESDAPPPYEDGSPKPADPEVNLIRTQPITASLRATILHLKARAGFWSRFRGLSVYFAWNAARAFVVGLLSVTNNPVITIVAGVVAEVVLANLHMTWIHVIISEPSEKRWYHRIPRPFLKTWKKIAPAVAMWAITSQIVTILPLLATGSFGVLRRMDDPTFEPGMKDAYLTAGQLFLTALLTVILFIGLQIPATVAMVRVAASMLPEEDETIVPFDRTFGGLTTPEIIGGQGKIGIVEAWRSFGLEQRHRLIRTVTKVAGIVMVFWLLSTTIIMAEAHLLFGDALGELMKGIHGVAKGSS